MKINKLILFIFSCIWFYSCSNNDDAPSNLPPNNFSLIQIEDNSTNASLNPKFSWTRADDPNGDAVTYSVLLSKGEENLDDILISNLEATYFSVNTNLEINTLYKWQVIASDDKGATINSEIFSFTTRENLPPEVFNLLQVTNNENDVVLKPTLTWENSNDPDGDPILYDVFLDTGNEDPTTIIANDLQLTSFEINDYLDYNTTYSWQVIASDDAGNRVSSEVFSFTTRKFKETLVTSEAAFSTRTEHAFIEFNGKLWIIGGYHASNGGVNGGLLNDVWSSSDGVIWTEEVPNDSATSFPPRADHTALVFQNQIWVIGGGGVNSRLNDVWSSPDGVNWTQETDNAGFVPRLAHTSVVFNDQIWVVGGEDGTLEYNDVWSSPDGINWTLKTNSTSFLPRFQHTSTVFQGKMWVIGGINSVQGSGAGDLNDVWSSTDGINWTLETINSNFSPRRGHSSIVYKNRIWVIAGNLKNDLWSSKDGINWNQETEIINFSGRGEQANVIFDDKLWVVGGWMGSLLNDVWFFN